MSGTLQRIIQAPNRRVELKAFAGFPNAIELNCYRYVISKAVRFWTDWQHLDYTLIEFPNGNDPNWDETAIRIRNMLTRSYGVGASTTRLFNRIMEALHHSEDLFENKASS